MPITDAEGILMTAIAIYYVLTLAGPKWVFRDAWVWWFNFLTGRRPD